MVRGLTDKESLGAVMKEARGDRAATARVKELAGKGLRFPHQLTPDETEELCSAVLRQIERRERS